MKWLLVLVSLVFICVGFSLINSYHEVKDSSSKMAKTIIEEPMNDMQNTISTGQSPNFDYEKYEKNALSSVGDFTFKYINFESDLEKGIGCLIAGFSLLIFATRDNLKSFVEKTIDFFV